MRRQQLVLLERAAAVFEEALAGGVALDSTVCNTFISAAGRASQLPRAFRALDQMRASTHFLL